MEPFFRTHRYLVDHVNAPVRRTLMDEIDWSDRMIGIKGTRGIGKTTFLLQYAKEKFDVNDRQCLYVNMNNFYFQGRGIADFAGESSWRKGAAHRPGVQTGELVAGTAELLRPLSGSEDRVYGFERDATEGRELRTERHREIV